MLGLLGRMAANISLFEPFRNQPSITEVRNCLLKLLCIHGELQRYSRRGKNKFPEEHLPNLWILSPSCSVAFLEAFGAKIDQDNNWPAGVYFLPKAVNTCLVAINQLPTTEDTLWLRLLGKGPTLRQAVNDLLAMPEESTLRDMLSSWRISLEAGENLTNDDRELIMELSAAYLRWREATLMEGMYEGLQRGIQEGKQVGKQVGIQEERRITITNLMQVRFGVVDEELSAIIQPLLQLSPAEYTPLLLNLSREELLTRFKPD